MSKDAVHYKSISLGDKEYRIFKKKDNSLEIVDSTNKVMEDAEVQAEIKRFLLTAVENKRRFLQDIIGHYGQQKQLEQASIDSLKKEVEDNINKDIGDLRSTRQLEEVLQAYDVINRSEDDLCNYYVRKILESKNLENTEKSKTILEKQLRDKKSKISSNMSKLEAKYLQFVNTIQQSQISDLQKKRYIDVLGTYYNGLKSRIQADDLGVNENSELSFLIGQYSFLEKQSILGESQIISKFEEKINEEVKQVEAMEKHAKENYASLDTDLSGEVVSSYLNNQIKKDKDLCLCLCNEDSDDNYYTRDAGDSNVDQDIEEISSNRPRYLSFDIADFNNRDGLIASLKQRLTASENSRGNKDVLSIFPDNIIMFSKNGHWITAYLRAELTNEEQEGVLESTTPAKVKYNLYFVDSMYNGGGRQDKDFKELHKSFIRKGFPVTRSYDVSRLFYEETKSTQQPLGDGISCGDIAVDDALKLSKASKEDLDIGVDNGFTKILKAYTRGDVKDLRNRMLSDGVAFSRVEDVFAQPDDILRQALIEKEKLTKADQFRIEQVSKKSQENSTDSLNPRDLPGYSFQNEIGARGSTDNESNGDTSSLKSQSYYDPSLRSVIRERQRPRLDSQGSDNATIDELLLKENIEDYRPEELAKEAVESELLEKLGRKDNKEENFDIEEERTKYKQKLLEDRKNGREELVKPVQPKSRIKLEDSKYQEKKAEAAKTVISSLFQPLETFVKMCVSVDFDNPTATAFAVISSSLGIMSSVFSVPVGFYQAKGTYTESKKMKERFKSSQEEREKFDKDTSKYNKEFRKRKAEDDELEKEIKRAKTEKKEAKYREGIDPNDNKEIKEALHAAGIKKENNEIDSQLSSETAKKQASEIFKNMKAQEEGKDLEEEPEADKDIWKSKKSPSSTQRY